MNIESLQIASRSNDIHGEIIYGRIPIATPAQIRRDQRTAYYASQADGRPFPPFRPRLFHFANRALVTSEHPRSAA
jgi:hypothetical protein